MSRGSLIEKLLETPISHRDAVWHLTLSDQLRPILYENEVMKEKIDFVDYFIEVTSTKIHKLKSEIRELKRKRAA